MLQLINKTPFVATMYVLPNDKGIDTAYAVLKVTYTLSPQPVVAEKQSTLVMAEEYLAAPNASSIKKASDFGLTKPATDVLLQGFAYAPGGRRVGYTDVTLAVGNLIRKTVRVFGDRTWQRNAMGWSPSAPTPLEAMPLIWERAAGGPEDVHNPVGCTARQPPNMEDPRESVSGPNARVMPAGFGPIAAHWEPRRSCAGTFDDHWRKNRAPYLPLDFNPSFFQAAPRDQTIRGYLHGGEPVGLRGCTPDGQLTFYLPHQRVQFAFRMDSGWSVREASLETVVIDTAAMLLKMTWRAMQECDKKALKIREVEVTVS
jgi:hypothetical protein